MSQKVAEKFQCEPCEYTCCKKSDMNKHNLTRKHQNRINRIELINKVATHKYVCSQCNKEYTARNSLWYHLKKCTTKNETIETNVPVNTNDLLIRELIATNKEMMALLITQGKELQKCPTTINQTTNNNNNQRFNINARMRSTSPTS